MPDPAERVKAGEYIRLLDEALAVITAAEDAEYWSFPDAAGESGRCTYLASISFALAAKGGPSAGVHARRGLWHLRRGCGNASDGHG